MTMDERSSPTGVRVGRNVARFREERGLHLRELSEALTEEGCPISLGQLSKLENGRRRVDTDELVALAVALNVTPAQLLMPPAAEPLSGSVRLTPSVEVGLDRAWQWMCGDLWLRDQDSPLSHLDEADWFADSRPHDFTGVYNFRPAQTRGHEAAIRQVVTAARAAMAGGMSARLVASALAWYLDVSPESAPPGEESTRG